MCAIRKYGGVVGSVDDLWSNIVRTFNLNIVQVKRYHTWTTYVVCAQSNRFLVFCLAHIVLPTFGGFMSSLNFSSFQKDCSAAFHSIYLQLFQVCTISLTWLWGSRKIHSIQTIMKKFNTSRLFSRAFITSYLSTSLAIR